MAKRRAPPSASTLTAVHGAPHELWKLAPPKGRTRADELQSVKRQTPTSRMPIVQGHAPP